MTGCGSDLAVSRNQPTYSLPMGETPDFRRIMKSVSIVKETLFIELSFLVSRFKKVELLTLY